MRTFLFWNLNKKRLEKLVADLAQLHDVDVLILTECEIPTHVMLEALNRKANPKFHLTEGECREIVIYTRFSSEFLQKMFETARLTIRRLRLPDTDELILAAVHHPSKLHWRDASQNAECYELSSSIRRIEDEEGHRKNRARR
jgi:endonuclease/exonuclease/phosphatase (EEP) superfamily protein YafD